MGNYICVFFLAFAISLGLTPLIRFLAIRKKLAIPTPRERDIHKKPIPRLGGVVIFLTFWLIVIGYLLFVPERLYFVEDKIWGVDKNLFGLGIASLIVFLAGLYDDLKSLNPWQKLFFQILAGLIVVYFGIKMWGVPNPFSDEYIYFKNWTYLLVPVWIVFIINVVNWLDGIDGLASGISVITLIILTILSLMAFVNQPATALLCAVLAGATLGFLAFNFNPAKIFLGDNGSMFLGLMIAVFAIISGGKIATVALVLGIPILDTLWVIARRIISKKSPMKADKYHLHHRFLEAGFSQKSTVIIFYIISIVLGIVALQAGTKGKLTISLWLVVIMFIMGIGLIILAKKKKGGKNV